MKNYRRILPHYSLEKAYEAGKHTQRMKKDYFLYKTMFFNRKRSWHSSILSYTNTELDNSVLRIYLSLFEYRIGLYLIKLFHVFGGIIPTHRSHVRSDKDYLIARDCLDGELIRGINRKLTWIEATLNDLRVWKRYYLLLANLKRDNDHSLSRIEDPGLVVVAHESVGLLPRSITRTISRFKAELVNTSNPSVLREFGLAKYQALASLQYIGCLLIIPSIISFLSQKYLSGPWIHHWWDNKQSQIFIASPQEDKALEEFEGIEELSWSDKIVGDSLSMTEPQSLDDEIHSKTIELVIKCNENSIDTLSHLSTDIIYLITVGGLFATGKERLAILNSWAQELFYSLSDTMKAFSILLVTDSWIGFHSPHGWELAISFCLEHFGFARDKRVISCLVSTFPVVLDTVLKYLISRHLNRISPSIVATYHTMNE